ncbi:MAG: hypothetical protein KAT83_02260 [Candidatus Aenigmarchaeota archaeon]|nr:hypothetical protein [Candidatus Aenigmarchaeota archaeon]
MARGFLERLFPGFITKDELKESQKAHSGEISALRQSILNEQSHVDRNFHILASKMGEIEGKLDSFSMKGAPSAPAQEFETLARLTVQNYEDLKKEREKTAGFEKKLSEVLSYLEEGVIKVNSTQLTKLNSVNSTKLNRNQLNSTIAENEGMTGYDSHDSHDSHDENYDVSVIPKFVPNTKLKLTQGHYSVLFVLYNIQADSPERAVSIRTIVKEAYGPKAGHSKESFLSRIVRELSKQGLVIKGPRGRTTRVYLSKEGIGFSEKHILNRKEEQR